MFSTSLLRKTGTGCLLVLLFFSFSSCKKKEHKTINPAFGAYISAFTSGVVSKETTIKIRLATDYKDSVDRNKPISQKLFSFDPPIKGKAYWLDQRTVEFRPDAPLESGQFYDAEFYLSKVVKVPDSLKTFEFQFQIIKQSFEVSPGAIRTYASNDLNWYFMEGNVLCADVISNAEIEKVLTAKQNGKALKITWTHTDDRRLHAFKLDSVQRMEQRSKIELSWNGKPIKVDVKGEKEVQIPALGEFNLMNTTVVQQPEQYVSLQYSDPLNESQDLTGLIRFESGGDVRTIIEGNEIKVYPESRLSGSRTLIIAAGIKNVLDYKINIEQKVTVLFEDIKPEVRLVGNGVILPNSRGLMFPFEAVNLRSVTVKISRIYANNMGQFLQINQLDGTRELYRVARTVYKKNVKLQSDKPVDFGKWNTFYLDISKLVKSEPGAVYNVRLSFKKKDSMYPCGDTTSTDQDMEEIEEEDWDADESADNSYWDYYDEYYYDEDYEWSERENPCNSSYYNSSKHVSRNIFASDLGIIAKGGSDGKLFFAVTDMITTNTLSGVDLEVYNFQNQLMGTARTGADGLATLEKLKGRPYLLIAKRGEQRGYLRLDDGSSLALGKFDVSGEVVQKGLKGFIYGERGVWRPGDTIYTMFVLEDEQKKLPANHPVVFELTDPQGQLVYRTVKSNAVNNFYNFTTSTDPSAPTGNWMATVKVGGTAFSKTIKVETIKPNRLKIGLDFGKDKIVSNSGVSGTLSATWLSGATARNLKANVMVTLTKAGTKFPQYKDYVFDDPSRSFYPEEQTVFDGNLNSEGKVQVSTNINLEGTAPGMLQANFVTKVFEEGGEFSIDRFTVPYSPYPAYVGIQLPKGDKARNMLLTDTNHTVQVVTVDADGKPVKREGLKATVYEVQWRWWWESNADDLSNYVDGSYSTPVANVTFNTGSDGRGTFQFRVNYPEWGRYFVKVEDEAGGHSTGQTVYIDWPGWAGRAQRENPGGESILSFTADKAKYQVNENAVITFPSSGIGRALVSIENGSKVLKAYWVNAEKNQTKVSIPITAEMAPNAYVHITLLQPHAQKVNDLPIRLYGMIPLFVEDPATKLTPLISMADVLKPEENVAIKVSEATGKPMTYTLAVVDEGLLDLTRFKTPDPWASFYAREALGVKTWDMYDLVMGAFTGEMEHVLGIGGDGIVEGANKNKAKRFKPVVQFFGPFELKAGQSKTTTFKMPNYVGAVRTMVIAGDPSKGAYGNADKSTPVRKPLMVLATLPRVLGPGEKVKLPVTVFAMEKQVKNVSITVTPSGPLKMVGGGSKSISFTQIGDQVVNFEIDVAKSIGIGKVKVVATSGKERSEYDIEIDVRNPNPPVTKVWEGVADGGKTWQSSYSPVGMAGTNKAILEVSSVPPIDFGRRLQYLLSYPHGCIEQTTSSAFPQLFLSDVIQMDDKAKQRASDNVKAALNRIRLFQNSDGGFAYWPGYGSSDNWGTNYAGHFMLEAEAKGFTLPAGMKDNWKKYQANQAKNWTEINDQYYYQRNDVIQAYRLYTLALAKAPEMGAMNRLREKANLSQQARFRLAAAYALAGQPEIANKLIAGQSLDVAPYMEMYYSYGSDLRDEAMILETLTLLKRRADGMGLVQTMAKRLQSMEWLSTQTTAYCLIALSKFTLGGTNKGLKFNATVNGKAVQYVSQLSVMQIPVTVSGTNGGSVSIVNQGQGVLYARLSMTGIPETGAESAQQNGLEMTVSYKDLKGNEIDISRMEQGTDFMVEVTLKNPSALHYQNLALNQIFPSGWEIHNDRLDGGSTHTRDIPTYRDIRDDRVYTYFDLAKGQSKTFVTVLNSTYLGDYYLPAVYCEAMYDNRINALKLGKWVKVIAEGNAVGMK
ncbi:MAG: MG2 domain-containing protein [Chitinophagales bacterium]|nr:MG2 domain-containing protein [Chitinophagales bacterium]